MTKGNQLHRYIGRTEEEVCEAGMIEGKQRSYPEVEMVYTSPMIRCVQTADAIYPENEKITISELRECDFGDFENKNYKELAGNEAYQKWIDSNGTLPFPNGESVEEFKKRCITGFYKAVEQAKENGYETIAIVAHGGTFMSVLEALEVRKMGYFGWKLQNGQAYITEYVELEQGGYLRGTTVIEEK